MRYTVFLPSVLAAFGAAPSFAQEAAQGTARPWQLGFQDAATPVMERLHWLHNHFLLYIIAAITAFVLLLTLYICVRFRRGAHPVPSKTTHNTLLEIAWTVVPILILVAIAIPSLRAHYFMQRNPEYEMTVKAVGRQWYWSYEYPDHGNFGFDSYIVKDEDIKEGQLRLLDVDNRLVVPVDTNIRVQLTGADVIHAWAVPAFGVKKDAMPGRLNETWFKATKTGVFYGQCSELCGVGHGFMPIAVEVVSKDEFAAWVAAKQKEMGLVPEAKGSAAAPQEPPPKAPAPQSAAEASGQPGAKAVPAAKKAPPKRRPAAEEPLSEEEAEEEAPAREESGESDESNDERY